MLAAHISLKFFCRIFFFAKKMASLKTQSLPQRTLLYPTPMGVLHPALQRAVGVGLRYGVATM